MTLKKKKKKKKIFLEVAAAVIFFMISTHWESFVSALPLPVFAVCRLPTQVVLGPLILHKSRMLRYQAQVGNTGYWCHHLSEVRVQPDYRSLSLRRVVVLSWHLENHLRNMPHHLEVEY